MSESIPPSENLPIFDNSVFYSPSDTLTVEQASKLFLKYPTSQGSETINGTLSVASSLSCAEVLTTNITTDTLNSNLTITTDELGATTVSCTNLTVLDTGVSIFNSESSVLSEATNANIDLDVRSLITKSYGDAYYNSTALLSLANNFTQQNTFSNSQPVLCDATNGNITSAGSRALTTLGLTDARYGKIGSSNSWIGVQTFVSAPVMSGASITSGTIPDTALNSTNVPLKNTSNTFTNTNTFTNAGSVTFNGNTSFGSTTTITCPATLNIQSNAGVNGIRMTNTTYNAGGTLYKKLVLDNGGSFCVYNQGDTGAFLGPSSTAWAPNASDSRLKTDIYTVENSLDKICALNPCYFKLKSDLDTNRVGFIAQDIEQQYPNICLTSGYSEEIQDNVKTYCQTDLIPYMVKAIQELKQEIELLKSRI